MSEGKAPLPSNKVFAQDGYTVAPSNPATIQNGFKPTTGQLGTPPTGGSAVTKPAPSK